MDVMAWTALLELNGMGAIHEAAARITGRTVMNMCLDGDDDEPADIPLQEPSNVFTPDAREYIRLHYPTQTAQEIATHLGMNKASVATIAHRMGVKKEVVRLTPEQRLANTHAAQAAYNRKRDHKADHAVRRLKAAA